MAAFSGSETFALDPKGRVNIPAKMKKCIPADAESTFVLTRGVDGCIDAYPKNIWENKWLPQLENLNPFNRDHAKLIRMMLRYCEYVTLDSIQRLMISKDLIGFANIEGNVMINGANDKIELWNPDKYEKYMESIEESYEDIAERVMAMNFENVIKDKN